MKVLYLVPDDGFFWSHRRGLAAAARDAGCEVVVATPPGPYRERIEAAGFAFRPVRIGSGSSPLNVARSIADVVALYRDVRPELCHHVSMRAILAGGLAARITRVPAVVNLVTGLGWVYTSAPAVLRRAVELAYHASLGGPASWTVFQNPDDRDEFVARGVVDARRASVILGSGVDAERFRPSPEPQGDPTILLASRMLAPKGIHDLVEAGRLLRARGVRHRIVLAGRPDERNPSSIPVAELARWNATGLVEWNGHTDDVAGLLRDCHVACLPTYYREGVPKFLLEAMAAGRPIVTTDTPGCRELVPERASGELVDPRRPDALADALSGLIADPEARRAKGRAARELVDTRFTERHVIEQTFAVYAQATNAAWRDA